jgi:hypothetical protein
MKFERLDPEKHHRKTFFYKKFGFKALSASKNRLVLSYAAMKSLL